MLLTGSGSDGPRFLKLISVHNLRGFALNTANYQPVGVMCPEWDWCLENKHSDDICCKDPCHAVKQYNSANNELNFAHLIHNFTAKVAPDFDPYFIIDTSRNAGEGPPRLTCSSWCNSRGAGVGRIPTTETGYAIIDGFLWLKQPGESDGCTSILPDGSQCARHDFFCGLEDSIGSRPGEPRAPEAGQWFDYQVKQLAENAQMR
jgi:hypothetical protein